MMSIEDLLRDFDGMHRGLKNVFDCLNVGNTVEASFLVGVLCRLCRERKEYFSKLVGDKKQHEKVG